jgi:hypothetical protein
MGEKVLKWVVEKYCSNVSTGLTLFMLGTSVEVLNEQYSELSVFVKGLGFL